MRTSWRVFCAIELPENVRAQLQKYVVQLREEAPDTVATWSRVENIHLTLKFLGNVDLDRVPAISAAAARAVKEFSPFEIGLGKTGVFPKPSRAQVLWIGVSDPSGTLLALQQGLERECTAEGFPREDRVYRPHLTIARIRKPEGARRLGEAHTQMIFEHIALRVKELVVFRSEMSSQGSTYTALSRHRLSDEL